MYRCEICGESSKPGDQAYHIIVETRDVSYPRRAHSQAPMKRKDRTKRKRWRPDPGGSGMEIVNEALACVDCAAKYSRKVHGAGPGGQEQLAAHG